MNFLIDEALREDMERTYFQKSSMYIVVELCVICFRNFTSNRWRFTRLNVSFRILSSNLLPQTQQQNVAISSIPDTSEIDSLT